MQDNINTLNIVGSNCEAQRTKLCAVLANFHANRQKQSINGAAELAALLSSDRLRVGEIRHARTLIDAFSTDKAADYRLLQEKVIYVNQRDNQAVEGKNSKIEDRIYGGTCNVSSLAMALKYVGVTTEDLLDFLQKKGFDKNTADMQYEDLVEYAGQYGIKNWYRYSHHHLGKLAEALGRTSYQVSGSYGYLGQSWYEENLLPELQSGAAAIMSIRGHIVRIQGMNEDGLIVDDPFGKTVLKKGLRVGNYGIGAANDDGTKKGYHYNKKQVEGAWNEGEDNLWDWSSLEKHGTFWIRIIK